ncbi:hypothetical protein Cs7R123_69590 [Catellatospora sp. TT07R-123]|uniref:S1C family serine protease n=1 Tax=Catellatospora sp. TT07R-123 TaxID=2733863 RepID=UPI001AFF2181|nr:trypsin-like peptidase domain-containing protein [Catellatospora sp. TT07R-123]GHJ49617.1 hypothetical protein Cs7R123_69590 [Catellatospora sp. TT07R-123]
MTTGPEPAAPVAPATVPVHPQVAVPVQAAPVDQRMPQVPMPPGSGHPAPAQPVPVPAQPIPAQPQPYGAVPTQPLGPFPPRPLTAAPGGVPHAVPIPVPSAIPAPPAVPMPPAPPRSRGGLRRLARWDVLTSILTVLLVATVVWQSVTIAGLSSDLDGLRSRLDADRQAAAQAQQAADTRIGALEKKAGEAFDAEHVAAAVLPSVFRVEAGDYTGTAFAVGPAAAGGGTNLFTNFHVVAQVWNQGGRTVKITRDGQRFDAKILAVNKLRDVAHLQTTAKFTGLTVATETVRPGQQIVVVGAPLGLTDTVTTGVVSALREDEDEAGPMIQFDAAINPGNSGGPVINGSSQVVGIAVAKYTGAEGLGLAIPIADACKQFKVC